MDLHCYSPILTAAESGHAEAFLTLLKFRGPGVLDVVDKDGKSALFLAAESNYLKLIKVRNYCNNNQCNANGMCTCLLFNLFLLHYNIVQLSLS